MTNQQEISFDKYTILVEQTDYFTFQYTLLVGKIYIGHIEVIQNKNTFNLITEFIIFREFRKQGHGTNFLKWMCNYLKKVNGKEIRLFPVGIFDEMSNGEDIFKKYQADRTAIELRTEKLRKFYEKRGFELKDGGYMVFEVK